MGVVVRKYLAFLILLIPTPLVFVLFCSSIPIFSFFKMFFFLVIIINSPYRSIMILRSMKAQILLPNENAMA